MHLLCPLTLFRGVRHILLRATLVRRQALDKMPHLEWQVRVRMGGREDISQHRHGLLNRGQSGPGPKSVGWISAREGLREFREEEGPCWVRVEALVLGLEAGEIAQGN